MVIVFLIPKKSSKFLYMKNKKGIIIPKVNYTYRCNVNNTTPQINIKKNDYDSIRNIVEEKSSCNNENEKLNTNEKIIKKLINNFHIV